jgi:hypothetical protein
MYCGLAEDLSPQITKKIGPQIRKLSQFVRKSNKLYKSANFRICDLRNLFADSPPLKITKS